MTYNEIKVRGQYLADVALKTFGESKINNMTFILKENGHCTAFMKSGNYYLWYWFDFSAMAWQETHMLLGDNWITP